MADITPENVDAALEKAYNNPNIREQNLRQSMIQAQDMHPDEAAKAIPIAQQNQIPLDMAVRNLPELSKNQEPLDYKNLLANYPTLSAFMTDPENAAVAHDDVPGLQKVSAFFSNADAYLHEGYVNNFKSLMGAVPKLYQSFAQSTGNMAQNLSEMTEQAVTEHITHNKEGSADYLAAFGGGALATLGEGAHLAASGYQPIVDALKVENPTLVNHLVEALGTIASFGGIGAMAGKAALTPMAANKAAAKALMGMFYVLGTGGTLESEKQDVVGPNGPLSTYGTPKGEIAAWGVSGPLNALLASSGISSMLHTPPQSVMGPVSRVIGGIKSPMIGKAFETAFDLAYKGLVGGGQMGLLTVGQNATDKFLLGHSDRDITQGAAEQTGIMGAAAVILGALMHAPTIIAQSQAKSSRDFFKASKETLADNKLLKRAPDKMRALIDAQTGGADVHVNPEAMQTFYQGMDPEDRAKLDINMPSLAKDIQGAMVTKADMPINQGDFHAYIQPHDLSGSLEQWTKLAPEHMTEGEMNAYETFMQGLFDTVDEQNRGLIDMRSRDSRDTQENIYNQLQRFNGYGRSPSAMVEAAKMISENPAKFYETMMSRTGNRADIGEILNRLIRDVQIRRVLPETTMRKGEMDLMLDDLRNVGRDATKAMQEREARAAERDALRRAGKKVRNYYGRSKRAPTPIMDYIGKLGGIRKGSPIAPEISSMGINRSEHPQMFNKYTPPDEKQGDVFGKAKEEGKYGLKSLDNLVHSEFEKATGVAPKRADNTDYVDQNWLMEQLRKETFDGKTTTEKDHARESLLQMLDYLNLDINKHSNSEIKRAIAAAEAEQKAALEANGTFYQGKEGESVIQKPYEYLSEKKMGKVLMGDTTEYDPLLDLYHVAAGDARASVFDHLGENKPETDTSWHNEKVTVKIDGKRVKVKAGEMAEKLSQRVNALSKLAGCLG